MKPSRHGRWFAPWCFLLIAQTCFSQSDLPPPQTEAKPEGTANSAASALSMKADFSIPVFWEGREMGKVLIPAGAQLELEKVDNSMLVCRYNRQLVRIPAALTNFYPALHKIESAKAQTPEPVASKPMPAQTATATPTNSPNRKEDWDKLVGYADKQLEFCHANPQAIRFQQYSFLKNFSPDPVRMSLRRVLLNADLAPEERDFAQELQVAFDLYRRGRWAEFENSVRIAIRRLRDS